MIWKFILKCMFIYLVLIGVGYFGEFHKNYSQFIQNSGNHFLNTINGKAKVKFRSYNKKEKKYKITISGIEIKYDKNFYVDIWRIGFMPLMFTIALILSSNYKSVKSKLWVFSIGILSINIITLIGLKLKSIYYFNLLTFEVEASQHSIYPKLIEFINHSFLDNIVAVLIIPVFVWVAISFNKVDLFKRLAGTSIPTKPFVK